LNQSDPAGASVTAKVLKDAQGKLGLFTDEALYAGITVIRKAFVCQRARRQPNRSPD
jgi:hypothetical protein